ncbi:MAG: MFS transporter [Clostridia bacterium]|nr:MFS transporter [Clostridia bacterium]
MNRKRFWIALFVFSLIGQIAWVVENMYFNVFIYHMFNASQNDIALMVQASAVAATVTTLLIGALSDRLGKRKAFITVGYILWGVSILVFAALRVDWIAKLFPAAAENTAKAASIGVALVIIFDCIMTFFGSSANDACFNAWLTDSTDETNRGKAEGINAMMPLVAILVVFGGTMWTQKSNAAHWTILFLIIGGIVLVSGVLGFFLIDEKKIERQTDGYFSTLFYGFRPRVIRENADLYLALLSFTIFGISIQVFMPYLILYYTEALHLDNYVLIMAPAIVLAAVATALYGRIYDRIGYRKTLVPALLVLMLGYAVLYLFRNTALVFLGSLLMMCGYLGGMAVFGARVRDCTPAGMAGRFQGLRIIGQVLIPGVVGPEIAKLVLKGAETVANDDGTFSFIPNENIFLWAGIVLLPIAAVIVCELLRLKKAITKPVEKA